jgi:AN1-type zinc finger protein 1
MATPSTSRATAAATRSSEEDTYTAMHELESIGAHCAFCRQKDFLPFRCESCKEQYCLEHRTEDAHWCKKKGAFLRARAERIQKENGLAKGEVDNKKAVYKKAASCAEPNCNEKIDVLGKMGVPCDDCQRKYCWKHRFPEEHDCKRLQAEQASIVRQQREKGLAALAKLRLWGAERKASLSSSSKSIQTKVSSSTANDARVLRQKINDLKQTAKGDAKLAIQDRIYLFAESRIPSASPSPSPARSPTQNADASPPPKPKYREAKVFYSSTTKCGRILDMAAKDLKIENLNNRAQTENEKLHLGHFHGIPKSGNGQFKELVVNLTLEKQGVKTGDYLVVYKGSEPPVEHYL